MPVPSEVVEIPWATTSPSPAADWELNQLVVDEQTPTHIFIPDSPLVPTAPPLKGEHGVESVAYVVHTSPITPDADTDPLPHLRFTPAVKTLPMASPSMGGHISPTSPTARWTWSSSDDDDTDNYRAMVDDCADAIVRHVRCVMNTCCRSRIDKEVRACFGILFQETMESAFLDNITNQILD